MGRKPAPGVGLCLQGPKPAVWRVWSARRPRWTGTVLIAAFNGVLNGSVGLGKLSGQPGMVHAGA